ncbi:hypothetical protein CP976_34995 [Streptomyces coeruleorubidus]|uniref:Uncharacterized protein n=1 Tax=Streptomyces coeruleorubidus TaxID=116188 RepID=A0A5J6IJ69_STRC4|nr:hypothetical protein CP976_34995 [Streptomyces coeruleorubidus]
MPQRKPRLAGGHEVDRVRLPIPRIIISAGRDGLLAELLQLDAAHAVMDPVQRPQFRREPHADGLLGTVDLSICRTWSQQAARNRRMLAQPRAEPFPRPLESVMA